MVFGYNDHLVTAIYTLLEHLLGEKAFANEFHYVHICQLTVDVKNELDPVPLYALAEYLANARTLTATECA